MDIILSTRNNSKAKQISALFTDSSLRLLTLDEAGIDGEVIEDGDTLGENAFKKANFAWQQTKQWCMADDTGLFIDALDGLPGIHAARWAGATATTEEIMQFTLNQLAGVPLEKRTATFRTFAAVIDPDGNRHSFLGELHGKILLAPRTACQPHLPYSAIFQADGKQVALSEMTLATANKISHRGQAFAQVHTFLLKH